MKWKIRKVWIDGVNIERIFIEDENNTRIVMLDFADTKDKENAKLIVCAPELLDILDEARLQIEYLQSKFKETGTGNSILSRINEVIERAKS